LNNWSIAKELIFLQIYHYSKMVFIMLKRIFFCLCLTGLVQVTLPYSATATQTTTATTMLGGVDNLPQHVLTQLFRLAGEHYRMSYSDASSAYLRGSLIMFETPGPNGEPAVMMDLDGNCLLAVILDML
jgi:hypothetical protein